MNAKGKVFKYGDNVDTDVIIPARYLNIADPKELSTHAMEDIDDLDPHRPRSCSIATGVAAYGFISLLVEEMKKRCYNLDCTVYEIKNEFFGENITVAGLVTAGDISRQLRGKNLGRVLFLPDVMLRHEKDRFLDDRTPAWLEDKLGVKIHFVACDGYAFVSDILKLS